MKILPAATSDPPAGSGGEQTVKGREDAALFWTRRWGRRSGEPPLRMFSPEPLQSRPAAALSGALA
ncbi:hypothetical protein VULLAG_LOCUS19557 [Vulpes lagopus]